MTITTEQVRALMTDAGEAGDHGTVLTCEVALGIAEGFAHITDEEREAARVALARQVDDAAAQGRAHE